jgi:hypothetical protein
MPQESEPEEGRMILLLPFAIYWAIRIEASTYGRWYCDNRMYMRGRSW